LYGNIISQKFGAYKYYFWIIFLSIEIHFRHFAQKSRKSQGFSLVKEFFGTHCNVEFRHFFEKKDDLY